MRYVKKLDEFLAVFEKSLVVVFFSALILLISFNVISRNLFQISFQKILETTPSLVLWLALLGSSLALKYQRHIKLGILLRYCSNKFKTFAILAQSVFGMMVMGILLVVSIEFVGNEIVIFKKWGLISIIFPIFFATSFFRYFIQLMSNIKIKTQ
ncbi:MAG: TRAP transporter small permease subunit [Desulfobacterales bacterium]|nr:TRAP transporter small permease subunit [Deltaproteobacteria bacterium]NNL43234.1 TRAP transporter small permease subunit [Desulfobacterales bacterium]